MKKSLIAASILVTLSASLNAAVNEKGYAHMDRDGDGKVTQKEFVGHRDRVFLRNDKNKDGFVDASETPNEHFLKWSDADKDGKVSREEAVANSFRVARNFDKDKDGFLSMEELNPEKK